MPPPDLAIDIEISRSLVPRLPILAAMGVPEIWQATDSQVTILSLEAGEYREVTASPSLPLLSSQKLNEFLQLSLDLARRDWSEAVREWAAEVAAEQ